MTADNSCEYMDDLRIQGYDPLIPPQILAEETPLSEESKLTIAKARQASSRIMSGRDHLSLDGEAPAFTDDRVLLIIGPCSIHDPKAAIEYGMKLKSLAEEVQDSVMIVMRAYFEKPRTTVGWKGLINDPLLNGSYKINLGLRTSRKLLSDLTHAGIPVGCELLDTISPQYLADTISWSAIGARTTECQLHRELASGVSFSVGFKNGTEGSMDIAIDAIHAASHPHHFLGVTHQGLAAITRTTGNKTCHVILRGGKQGPNYSAEHVMQVADALEKSGLPRKVMVDCSHGNSQKQHLNQIKVMDALCAQIKSGDDTVAGIMVESNLVEGSQKIINGTDGLVYGKSVTDACVGWEDSVKMVHALRDAVLERRRNKKQ